MNDKLLIELIKIIKQSKQPIIKAFEDNSSRASYINFDSILEDIKKRTKLLATAIKNEADTFNKDYNSEEQMIKAVGNSFESINSQVNKLINIYKEVKNKSSDGNIQALLSLQISQKVLYDYIIWCEKLENALMGMDEDEVIYIPNTTCESEIISFIANNTKSNELNCWLPFFGGIGLGFLMDDG